MVLVEKVIEPVVIAPILKPAVGLVTSGGVSELYVRKSKDVVLKYTVRVEEIYERGIEMGLEEQIARIDAEILNTQTPVDVPKDASDSLKLAVNTFNAALPDVTELTARKAELAALKAKVEAVR